MLAGAATFQDNVDKIHSLGPVLPLVEWTFIFLPIIFHAVVGVMIIRSGNSNTSSYRYANNIRYTLQRATAWIALFFIFWHVFHMHGWIHNDWWTENSAGPLYGGQFNAEHATSSVGLALAIDRGAGVLCHRRVGVRVSPCNGLWTMGITWGIWTSPAAQRRATWVCAALGVLMVAVSMAALLVRHDARTERRAKPKRSSRFAWTKRQAELKQEEEIRSSSKPRLQDEGQAGRWQRTAGRRRAAIAVTSGPAATGERPTQSIWKR